MIMKQKITIRTMSLKSSIMSKLDHQMSRIWIEVVSPILVTTNKFGSLKSGICTWYFSSGKEFDENLLDSKHVLKVFFKPSRKKKDFVFLPVPILPVWLKIGHLIGYQIKVSLRAWCLASLLWRPCMMHQHRVHSALLNRWVPRMFKIGRYIWCLIISHHL